MHSCNFLQGIAMAVGFYFLLEPMVLAVLYIWCQLNKDTIVQFWFGTQFKAMYLPWILAGFNMIIRGGLVDLSFVLIFSDCASNVSQRTPLL